MTSLSIAVLSAIVLVGIIVTGVIFTIATLAEVITQAFASLDATSHQDEQP